MLIKNAVLINEKEKRKCSVRIADGKIKEIATQLEAEKEEHVIDASGYYLLPGGIDVHTHIEMPCGNLVSSDDYDAGTEAAVWGGTTTVMDFAEYDKGEKLQDGLDRWMTKSEGKSYCDYSFHMTVSGWDETTEEQIHKFKSQGITSFKAYTAYQDDIGVNDKELFRILKCMKKIGGLLCVHCENGPVLECLQADLKHVNPGRIRNHPESRPNLVEKEAVSRVIDLAAIVDVPVYIVHVSTKEAVEVIRKAKAKGQKVYAETCPQYLLLDEEAYNLPGFESAKYVLSPPLRKKEDQKALWEALKDGTIDVVSTDHCSFNYHGQKDYGKEDFTQIPNGIPGIENRMKLMLTYGIRHGISLEKIVKVCSAAPAKIFGLYPKKGVLKIGSDADMILIKQEKAHSVTWAELHQRVDYTPYEGMEEEWEIPYVFVHGTCVVDHETWSGKKHLGRFQKCI